MPLVEYEVLGGQAIVVSMERHIEKLAALEETMIEAAGIVYAATEKWFDSEGEGTWAPLAESTIERKTELGAADPSRPLVRFGDLRASAISSSGPYSFLMPMKNGVAFGVNWIQAEYLSAGVYSGYGVSKIPARPIWPPVTSMIGMSMMEEIGNLIMTALHVIPAFPGANVARIPAGMPGAGQFTSMKL